MVTEFDYADASQTIAALCAHLKAWGINTVHGDGYGKPYISIFARNGITYQVTSPSTSEIYLHCLSAWTSGSVCMLDGHARAVDQLTGLRRKVGQAGREYVEHPKSAHAHDDLATVVSGIIWRCTPIERDVVTDYEGIGVVTAPLDYVTESSEESETWRAWLRTQNYGRAPDGGLGRGNSSRGALVW